MLNTKYSRYTRRNRFRDDDDRRNNNPMMKEDNLSLLKNRSTRLRFSVYVIIANFIVGIIGMIVGTDLTALGVFLSLSNSPLYVYILGRTLRPSTIPNEYYHQQHSGSGGLGTILNNNDYDQYGNQSNNDYNSYNDEYNIPYNVAETTQRPVPPDSVFKDEEEIG
jgi:hypothetical protein